jgi:hypothetical protein
MTISVEVDKNLLNAVIYCPRVGYSVVLLVQNSFRIFVRAILFIALTTGFSGVLEKVPYVMNQLGV